MPELIKVPNVPSILNVTFQSAKIPHNSVIIDIFKTNLSLEAKFEERESLGYIDFN